METIDYTPFGYHLQLEKLPKGSKYDFIWRGEARFVSYGSASIHKKEDDSLVGVSTFGSHCFFAIDVDFECDYTVVNLPRSFYDPNDEVDYIGQPYYLDVKEDIHVYQLNHYANPDLTKVKWKILSKDKSYKFDDGTKLFLCSGSIKSSKETYTEPSSILVDSSENTFEVLEYSTAIIFP